METCPPKIIESFVRALTPPASQDHVLGDLRERYVSPARYLRDALNTLPFVVASGIRRVFHPGLSAIAALILWFMIYQGPLQPGLGIVLTLVPTLLSVLVLVVRDVYRIPEGRWLRAAAIDVLAVAAIAALWYAMLGISASELFT